MKKITLRQALIAPMIWLMASTAHADIGLGITGGTTGIGISLTVPLYDDYLNLRGTYNKASLETDLEEDDVDYTVTVDLANYGLLIDWHPFGGSIRLTAGMMASRNEIDGTATPTTATEIGDVEFEPEDIGTIFLHTRYGNSIPGYVGFGWGNSVSKDERLTFSLDIGLMFTGEMEVELRADSPLGNSVPAIQAQLLLELEKEEANIEEDLSDITVWPVFNLGVAFRF